MKTAFCSFFFLSTIFLFTACHQGESQPPESEAKLEHVKVSWSSTAQTVSPGETFHLLWEFEMAEGWHLYGNGRNDSGFPPSVKVDWPEGWEAGPLLWPAPERYLSAGDILDHVYHEKLQLVQEVVAGPWGPTGEIRLSARVDWLACKDECVPGQEILSLVFPDRKIGPDTEIATALSRIPTPAPVGEIEVVWESASVKISVPEVVALEFYPYSDCLPLRDVLKDGSTQGESISLGLRAKPHEADRLKGILHQVLQDGSKRNWIIDVQPGG